MNRGDGSGSGVDQDDHDGGESASPIGKQNARDAMLTNMNHGDSTVRPTAATVQCTRRCTIC